MARPKASLETVLAPKPSLAVVEDTPTSVEQTPKAGPVDDNMTTTLTLKRSLMKHLKDIAFDRRVRVNAVIVEAIENFVALNGRGTTT